MKVMFIDMPEIEKQCRPFFKSADIESYNYNSKGPELLPLEEIEVIIGFPKRYLLSPDTMPNLKMIQLPSAGYDKIPLDELSKRGIMCANASGVYSIPIAEWCIAKILEIIKQSRYYYQNQSQLIWKKNHDMFELPGLRALIFGTGSIGQQIAKRLRAFDVIVDGVNSDGRDIQYFDQCLDMESGKKVSGNYDILIFSLPNNKHTAGLVNADFLANVKDNVIIINVGRGTLIIEADLINALNKGKIRAVALDVTETEPLPITSELWTHPNVIISPHSSFISDKIDQRRVELITFNIFAYYQKKQIKNRII